MIKDHYHKYYRGVRSAFNWISFAGSVADSRQEWAKRARGIAMNCFSWDINMKRLSNLYFQIKEEVVV